MLAVREVGVPRNVSPGISPGVVNLVVNQGCALCDGAVPRAGRDTLKPPLRDKLPFLAGFGQLGQEPALITCSLVCGRSREVSATRVPPSGLCASSVSCRARLDSVDTNFTARSHSHSEG